MAAGLPVVATRVGGIPFIVEDGTTGFLVEYGDVDGFARKIVLLLQDERAILQMAAAARARPNASSGRRSPRRW